jgi:short chain dehydrogenase
MAFTVPLRQATAIRRQCILWRIAGGGGGGGGDTDPRAPNRLVNPALVQQQSLLLQQQLQRGRRLISNSAVLCGSNSSSNNKTNNDNNNAAAGAQQPQSQSPLGHIGVEAALAASSGASVRPTIWDEFALKDRVALVSGANRGLGLEMALVLIEAGARAVYCVDLPAQPGNDWAAVSEYVKRMVGTGGGGVKGGRLEYISADVRDQKAMWKIGEEIGDREGRMDVCVAAAGILKEHTDCLEYPGEEFEEVRLFFLRQTSDDGFRLG